MEISKKTALILIDMQQGFDDIACWDDGRNNLQAKQIDLRILEKFRRVHLPIIHVKYASTLSQSQLNPNHDGFAFKAGFEPQNSEILITKNVNSAFIGTDLDKQLKTKQIETLVILGLMTEHCVSTTARMAGNMGYQVYLVSDATATFDKVGINGEKFDAELIH